MHTPSTRYAIMGKVPNGKYIELAKCENMSVADMIMLALKVAYGGRFYVKLINAKGVDHGEPTNQSHADLSGH